MRTIEILVGKILPSEWKSQLRKFVTLKLVTPFDAFKVVVLMLLALFFEAFGVAMVLPLFEFIESNRDIRVLTEKSRMWQIIEQIFTTLHLPISLLSLCIIIVCLITLRQIFNYKNIVALAYLKQRIGHDLSRLVFTSVLESKPSFIQDRDSGNFINLVDVQSQAAATLVRSYSTLTQLLTTFAVYAAIMVLTAPLASLIALVFTAFVIISMNYYVRLGRRLSQDMVKARQKFCSFVGERFQGWRVIKLSNAVPQETEKFLKRADQIFELTLDIFRVSGRHAVIISPLMSAFALLVLYISVEYLALSISAISLFIIILLRLTPTAHSLTATRQAIASHGASLDNVAEIIQEAKQEREIDTGVTEFKRLHKEIRFHDVTFCYPRAKEAALQKVCAHIPAGKMTAVIGASGAGKSTLLDILIRLITPEEGKVTVDGEPLDSFTLESLRRTISYASQNPFIFNASVRENLILARPNAIQSEIERACEMAYANEFIEEMSEKYETVLGEGGGRLSGGQRQRIALARAFLSGANILILDEPTSALDYDSEQKIQKAIDQLLVRGEMTVIVIAHRLSTIQNADHLIVLDSGRVVEEGPPDVLKKNQNWYGYITAAQGEK